MAGAADLPKSRWQVQPAASQVHILVSLLAPAPICSAWLAPAFPPAHQLCHFHGPLSPVTCLRPGTFPGLSWAAEPAADLSLHPESSLQTLYVAEVLPSERHLQRLLQAAALFLGYTRPSSFTTHPSAQTLTPGRTDASCSVGVLSSSLAAVTSLGLREGWQPASVAVPVARPCLGPWTGCHGW